MEPLPYTDASIAKSRSHNNSERAKFIWHIIADMFGEQWIDEGDRAEVFAHLLAAMNGYPNVDQEGDEHLKKHFGYWGWISARGSALHAGQFRIFPLAVHHAAQSAIDCYYDSEHCERIALSDPRCANYERKTWNDIAQKAILAYLDVLGDPLKTELLRRFYQLEQEASHGDPRRI